MHLESISSHHLGQCGAREEHRREAGAERHRLGLGHHRSWSLFLAWALTFFHWAQARRARVSKPGQERTLRALARDVCVCEGGERASGRDGGQGALPWLVFVSLFCASVEAIVGFCGFG